MQKHINKNKSVKVMSVLSNGPWSYNRFDAMDASYKSMYEAKKADKDYDGDGKVESSKDEYFGSKDKAIKKAMGKEVKEEKKELPDFIKKKMDEKDDKKGDKKGKKPCTCKEDLTKEHVLDYLVQEGFCNNLVSAEVLFDHMTDDWLEHIEDTIVEGAGMHREADTGKVVKKAEIGKTYYPAQKMQKTSVTKKPDAFGGRFKKKD